MTIAELRDGNNLKCTFRRNVIEVLYSFWLEIFRVSFYHPSVEADEIIWSFLLKESTPLSLYVKLSTQRWCQTCACFCLMKDQNSTQSTFFFGQLLTITRDNLAKRRKVAKPKSIHIILFYCIVWQLKYVGVSSLKLLKACFDP